MMAAQPEVVQEEHSVRFRIMSEFERDNIQNTTDLTAFMRSKTGCSSLVIKAIVDTSLITEKEVVYTAQQKFDKMREMYPEVNHFIDKFELYLD